MPRISDLRSRFSALSTVDGTVWMHSRPQSSSLLRMTDSEKSSGELSQKVCSDWLMIERMKPSLIGQFITRHIAGYIRNLQYVQGTVKEMDETPKKTCNRKVKICRCCNSHLSNVYDSIDLFGKTAQRENVIEKLKEVGKIEVQESDQDLLTTRPSVRVHWVACGTCSVPGKL